MNIKKLIIWNPNFEFYKY